jgi:lysozyme
VLPKLLADLRDDEGWRDSPYRDTEGFLTIGYGFLIDERKAVKMPRAVGNLWLELVAQEKWADLLGRLPWLSTQPENVQRALANMAYQMGVEGVLGFRTMLAALQAGDRARAADAALDSKWADQTPVRAKRVAALIRGVP